jgi:predicted MPP superfamily phosphohydrolase
MSLTRRGLLRAIGGLAAAGFSGAAYAVGIEPLRLRVQSYTVVPRAPWPKGLRLRIAALADIHACEPWMDVARIEQIVARTNALGADLVVLLGDYVTGQRFVRRYVDAAEWAPALARLRAPLGVYGVLGNHDWWEDRTAQRTGAPPIAQKALESVGIPVLENKAVPLATEGGPVWLAGLGDQVAFLPARRRDGTRRLGRDDLPGTMAQIPEGAPALLLAHEPDIFPQVPSRVALTFCGHTHGGQVRLLGYSPVVPSRFRNRYAYGHVREHTDLIVSGGLGCSIFPLRFGVPPEIVLVEIGGA